MVFILRLFVRRVAHWIDIFIFAFLNIGVSPLFLNFYGFILLFLTKFATNYLSSHLFIKITDGRLACPLISMLIAVFLGKISSYTIFLIIKIWLILIRIRTIVIPVRLAIGVVKLSICIIISFIRQTNLLILWIFWLFLFFKCVLHIQWSTVMWVYALFGTIPLFIK